MQLTKACLWSARNQRKHKGNYNQASAHQVKWTLPESIAGISVLRAIPKSDYLESTFLKMAIVAWWLNNDL